MNEGNETEVERLLKSGVDVNHKNSAGESALILAIKIGKKWIFEYILCSGIVYSL